MTTKTEQQAIKRLYASAKKTAEFSSGMTKTGWAYMMDRYTKRHLVAEQILATLAAQDESVKPETVVTLLNGLWDALNEDKELN